MKQKTKSSKDWTGELFTPPIGFIRPVPEDKQEEYRLKFKELGPFSFHQYDLDICKIYRQVDDLKDRYKHFAGAPFVNYVTQIKEGVKLILKERKLDADFYAEHFYCVLNYNDAFFKSFLGLFLALSDALEIVPILEYQYGKFIEAESDSALSDDFLNELEYSACNFIRTNRFPEDYFIKHDKIVNWIFSKREFRRYERTLESKMQLLLKAINKISDNRIPEEVLRDKKTDSKPSSEEPVIYVIESHRKVLFNDLKGCFYKKNHSALKQILNGTVKDASLKVIFRGNANQLVDVFRIYAIDKKLPFPKRDIAKWICNHFIYLAENKSTPDFFDPAATENMIYGQRLPAKGKRITLSGLEKPRISYYR